MTPETGFDVEAATLCLMGELGIYINREIANQEARAKYDRCYCRLRDLMRQAHEAKPAPVDPVCGAYYTPKALAEAVVLDPKASMSIVGGNVVPESGPTAEYVLRLLLDAGRCLARYDELRRQQDARLAERARP